MGRLAEQQAVSSAVKELAKQMVDDHSKSEQTLQQFLGNEETTSQEQPAQNRQTGSLDIVALKKQIARECAAWQKKELSDKRGQQFDSCFTGQQLAKHMEVICTERVLREYASPQLQQVIDQDLLAAERHYRMVREAIQQLKGESGSHWDSSVAAVVSAAVQWKVRGPPHRSGILAQRQEAASRSLAFSLMRLAGWRSSYRVRAIGLLIGRQLPRICLYSRQAGQEIRPFGSAIIIRVLAMAETPAIQIAYRQ